MAEESTRSERVEWANRLRLAVSPPEALKGDGTIDQRFFKPRRVQFKLERPFGEEDKRALLEGIRKYGVGAWESIQSSQLPDWDTTVIAAKASAALGTTNTQRYSGKRMEPEQVREEHRKNKELGTERGKWEAGRFVEDGLSEDLGEGQQREQCESEGRERGSVESGEQGGEAKPSKTIRLISPTKEGRCSIRLTFPHGPAPTSGADGS